MTNRKFTSMEMAAILIEHLRDKKPVSEICDLYEITAIRFDSWLAHLFKDAHLAVTAETNVLEPPTNSSLPFFVYGALKPGMPAFEQLRPLVEPTFQRDQVGGQLYVRDGLPLLKSSGGSSVQGFLLRWLPGKEADGYDVVCKFEARNHYKWSEVTLESGTRANTLVICSPAKGNPQLIDSSSWSLSDDPAFGPGLIAVQRVLEEVDRMPSDSFDSNWPRFFRSQMAYLLLWSILERLSALCFGPGQDPMRRIKRLHELPGMEDLVRLNVQRTDKVSDSRDPDTTYKLYGANAKKCFYYYYQVRSNLSLRGKGVFNEFDKVHNSLKELLAITQQYIGKLKEQKGQQ
jgi:gamma-glutamylcyclotransferase (GGCT)/AIG2-like uncharacterized protein YtfP